MCLQLEVARSNPENHSARQSQKKFKKPDQDRSAQIGTPQPVAEKLFYQKVLVPKEHRQQIPTVSLQGNKRQSWDQTLPGLQETYSYR